MLTPKRIIRLKEIKLSKNIVVLLKKGRELRRISREIPSIENIIAVKRTRRQVRIELKKFKVEAEQDKLLVLNEAMVTADVREMWRLIRMKVKNSRRMCSLTGVRNKAGKTTNNPVEGLNIWKEHFEYLARKEEKCVMDDIIPVENLEIAEITDAPIEWSEIVATLEAMKNNKAASEDKIPVELYKILKSDNGNSVMA